MGIENLTLIPSDTLFDIHLWEKEDAQQENKGN